ncbi:MAG: YfhO family protein [Oscillospiraceae bacterium]
MKNKYQKIIEAIFYYGIAFVVPILIITEAYKVLEIYPYGDKSILSMDLWGQYFPMLVEQTNANLSERLFSWNGSLGFNSFSQSGYYCNSIFNIFLMLCNSNEEKIYMLDKLLLIKFGLSSVTFSILLSYKYKKKNVYMLVGSIAYACCSYSMAYISQVMWFDSIIYLPLVLVGLERLLTENKPIFYSLMLGFTIFSSFYIGFSICIFLVLYFIVLSVVCVDTFKWKKFLKDFFKFGVFSVLAGGLSAFIILPIYGTISQTIASGLVGPEELKFYHSFADYIYAMFPNTKLSYEYYIPNIFTGDFIFLFIPLFFFNKEISIKKKYAYGSLLVFLYFSMNMNYLDYIWHGFHFPNQLPGRWTFIFSLVCLIMFSECLAKVDALDINSLIKSFIVSIFFIYFARYTSNENYSSEQAKSMVTTMLVYLEFLIGYYFLKHYVCKGLDYNISSVLNIFKKDNQSEKKSVKNIVTTILNVRLIPIVIMLGLSLNIVGNLKDNCVSVMENDTRVSDVKSYVSGDFISEYVKKFESTDDDFYRMELNSPFTFDSPQLYNYKGITYYSSTMNGNAYNLFDELGCRVYAQNVSTVYNSSSAILNSFLGVKYIINRDSTWKYAGLSEFSKEEKATVLQNDYYLPLAFHVSEDMANLNLSESKPLSNQNKLVNSAMGEDVDVYEKVSVNPPIVENGYIDEDDYNWNNYYYHTNDASQPITFQYSYTCTQDGIIYIQNNFRKGTSSITTPYGTSSLDVGAERFKCLGNFKVGDTITIDISVEDISYGLCGMEFYYFNTDKMNYVYQKLSGNAIDIQTFKNTKIVGSINMSEDGFVYTSIPDDNGWTVLCDGEKVDIVSINDSLIGFNLPQGEHTLTFKYNVPYLNLGLTISIVCLALILVISYLPDFITKKRASKKEQSNSNVEIVSDDANLDSNM